MAATSGATRITNDWRATATKEDIILEAWGQGLVVGALLIMLCITVASMKHKVLLHKLILIELVCAASHGTFCFMAFRGYGWYLSSTAALLYISSWIHNVVAWLKIRTFFRASNETFSKRISKLVTRIYLVTLGLDLVPLAFQVVNNFQFFNNINDRYAAFRPYETLMRDPWWVFVCIVLFHVIRKCYGASAVGLVKGSPRFGILVAAILLAIVFTVADIVASVYTRWIGATNGINPWWKLYLVSKCLTDTIMLDDFKTELNRLSVKFGAGQGFFQSRSTSLIPKYGRNAFVSLDVAVYRGGDRAGPTRNQFDDAAIGVPAAVHWKAHNFNQLEGESAHIEHLV